MSYRVNYRGLEVAVDSLDEIDALADRLQINRGKGGGVVRVSQPNPASVKEIVSSATTTQSKLLRIVLGGGADGVTDEHLRRELGLSNNKELAGMTAGISKRIASAGLNTPILKTEQQNIGGVRTYRYWIASESESEVREGLGV